MKRFPLLLLISVNGWAATAFTEFYCQTTGDNLNAGSSTANAAAFTYAGGTFVAATGVYTVASGNPLTDGVLVGDYVSIYTTAGATVAIFVSPCISRDATHITVAITAATGIAVGSPAAPSAGANACTAKVRGAWKGPNAAVAFPFGAILATATNGAGNIPRVNFLSGVNYGITSPMTHANNGPIRFQGYTSSVGDGGRAIIDGGAPGTAIHLLTLSSTDTDIEDFIFQRSGTGGVNGRGLTSTGVRNHVRRVVGHDCNAEGVYVSGEESYVEECEAYACNAQNNATVAGMTSAASRATFVRCVSHDNAGANNSGFRAAGGSATFLISCISESNGKDGLTHTGSNIQLIGCDFYNNAANGVDMTIGTVSGVFIENCNFIKNTTAGINSTGSALRHGSIVNCGFGVGTMANGTDLGANLTAATAGVNVLGKVSYGTGLTPWVDPANGDFRVVLTTAKGAGRGAFTETQGGYSGTSAWLDIGSGQHRDTASSVFAQ